MDSLFFKNSLLKVFPQGVSQKKLRIKIHFAFGLLLEEVCKMLDFKKKSKKNSLFFKNSSLKVFPHSASIN
jgi:hypothetical protein